jgi:acyl-CoA synthetase (AMP-forming)/AMP-acid ligase II
MNVAEVLGQSASARGDHPAIIEGAFTTSYGEWWARSRRIASLLHVLGVAPGDRVALLARNSTPFLEVLFGVFAAGGVIVPVNTRLHPREIDYIVRHSGARALVHEEQFDEGLATLDLAGAGVRLVRLGDTAPPSGTVALERALVEAEPVAPVARADDDLAWLFYTSGTTGRPKGAMVTHGNLDFMTRSYLDEVYPAGPDDRALHAGPLTHGSGLWAISLTAAGATQLVPASRGFSPPEVFGLIEEHAVTNLVFLAPTMIRMLLEEPSGLTTDCSSLCFLGYGGAPIHEDDQREAMSRWGEVMCNVYGQGECPMTISILSPAQHAEAARSAPGRLRSVGTPRGGLEIAVCDEAGNPLPPGEIGEVCVRGPVVMRGYWEDADATTDVFRAGWYHTGDLGTFDDEGFLYLHDRVKELVISGGANIYPREVENVIVTHDAVRDVAVFGIPDRLWGESVVAVIVPEPGRQVSEGEIEALCREHLASYKKPRFVVFADDLPRSAYGKVLKRDLAQIYASLAG